jgi:molybdopterin biosynthesis enzyme
MPISLSAMVDDSSIQRITRLTPLAEVLALIDARVSAVKPKRWAVRGADGYTLAEDVVAATCPAQPIALRDGYAVDANAVADAGAYAPVPLALPPQRIEVGQPLPDGADAILPLDAVVIRSDRIEAIAAVAVGEGVLPVGGDATGHAPLRRAGERLRSIDTAAICAAGVQSVSIRDPHIVVVCGSEPGSHQAFRSAVGLLVGAVFDAGATHSSGGEIALEPAVANQKNAAIIAVGGTGSGRNDTAVRNLARLGRVEIHGIAISPGETAAFGFVDTRPVLLVPGRLDAALAVWLLIGRHLVAKLTGGRVEDWPAMMPLKRKVTSTIGLTELVPVSCAGGVAEPLASGYLSFAALARSDGWIVVPADSEGYAAGTSVAVKPWP